MESGCSGMSADNGFPDGASGGAAAKLKPARTLPRTHCGISRVNPFFIHRSALGRPSHTGIRTRGEEECQGPLRVRGPAPIERVIPPSDDRGWRDQDRMSRMILRRDALRCGRADYFVDQRAVEV